MSEKDPIEQFQKMVESQQEMGMFYSIPVLKSSHPLSSPETVRNNLGPKTIEGLEPEVIEGIIVEKDYGDSDDVVFVQTDDGNGTYDDTPFAERMEDFVNRFVTVHYWVCNEKLPLETIQRLALEHIFGKVDARYYARYSDITGYLWTEEDASVGGHNVLEEIRALKGKYLYMEIYVHKD